jgi:hypothetical protein
MWRAGRGGGGKEKGGIELVWEFHRSSCGSSLVSDHFVSPGRLAETPVVVYLLFGARKGSRRLVSFM